MTDLILADKAAKWRRLKALVLNSVSSPITRRVYNLGLDEFFAWFGEQPRPGFTRATVSAWHVALEARGLGSISINVRITALRKLAAEAADNGQLALAGDPLRVWDTLFLAHSSHFPCGALFRWLKASIGAIVGKPDAGLPVALSACRERVAEVSVERRDCRCVEVSSTIPGPRPPIQQQPAKIPAAQ